MAGKFCQIDNVQFCHCMRPIESLVIFTYFNIILLSGIMFRHEVFIDNKNKIDKTFFFKRAMI